jgi:hypothetical protein
MNFSGHGRPLSGCTFHLLTAHMHSQPRLPYEHQQFVVRLLTSVPDPIPTIKMYIWPSNHMQSSPLIPQDKVSLSTNGSINARYSASWFRLQHIGDFWLQGTPTSPVYPTPIAVSFKVTFS